MKIDENNIAKITLIVSGCFLVSAFWWNSGFMVAIGIIIVWGMARWMIDDYDKTKRLNELEKYLALHLNLKSVEEQDD